MPVEARAAEKTAVLPSWVPAASGAAQLGQNLNEGSVIGMPQLLHGGAAAAGFDALNDAPQKAQKGSEESAGLPQLGQRVSAFPAGSLAVWTLVAGMPDGPLPDCTAEMAIADAESGLPQSMQNREPSSFCRPQWAQVATLLNASADIVRGQVSAEYTGRASGWSIELN